MRPKRDQRDMFGRAVSPPPVPAGERAETPPARRSIPPGLVPFLPVIALIVVLAAIVAVPVVGVALLVLVVVATVATILRARYRQVKDIDYAELLSSDPLWRRWSAIWRGVNGYPRDRPPPE